MRILMLTWEFPPLLTGGLGMACYGMAKALLEKGVEIELIIPVADEVYFRLRSEDDADNLPVGFVDPRKGREMRDLTVTEILKRSGGIVSPYFSTGERMWSEKVVSRWRKTASVRDVLNCLQDDYFLFRQVRNFTAMAVHLAEHLEFDLIHSHDWLTVPAGVLIKQLSGRPLVGHIHATEFDRAGGPGDGRIHHVEYLGTQFADRLIAVSAYTSSMVAERYRADRGKLRVVHNAYTLERNGGPKKRIFKEPTVLFMGRITLQKGPDYFLEVARRVLKEEKNVRFIMGGRGDMERKILHRAASFGLGTRFLFAGFLDRSEVEEVLSAADILIMPSVSEPFGIVPLEAMGYGAVAVISKQSGVAEVVKNAYKVDFWDIDKIVEIILELVRDPERLKEYSRNSVREVARLQWGEAAEKIISVYNEVKG